MDEREKRALLIVRDALDLDTAGRDDFLRERCADDSALRVRVDLLLDRIDRADDDTAPSANDDAPADALVGTRLGPFRVLELAGRGGMGVVYRGRREDADFEQEVALKLIRRGFDFDDVHARFLRERRILARLSHPNLARFIDGGVAPDGRPWFALEFVRGETIVRWCDARKLGLRQRVRLMLDVCAAVQYAHSQLVVHRDLKPANVLIDAAGSVRLLDFGIARLLGDEHDPNAPNTIAGRYALTPEYAAPEQFGAGDAGVAVDVYALGVILYELMSGVLPYVLDRADAHAAEWTVREMPPQPLLQAIARDPERIDERLAARDTSLRAYRSRVRGDLSRIVAKTLEKEPARRYGSIDAFADDLSRWLAGAPVRISGNGFGYRLGKFVRRNAVAVGIVVALSLSLLLATAWALRSAWLEHAQREAAMVEVERAAAVRDYVMLMFRSAGATADTSELTARDVLKRGADGIFERFRDEPATGQTTALMLAELYSALDDAEGAAPLLERLLDWPGIEANPDTRAAAQYLLADIRFQQGKLTDSRALIDAAQAHWLAQPQRHREALTRSRITQGRLERGEGRVEDSIRTLRDGIAARRRFLGKNDAEVGYMLVSLSISLSRVVRIDEAMQAADEACEVFADIGLEHSSPGLAAIANRSLVAWAADERESALADIQRAGELRLSLYGPSTELAKLRAHEAAMLAAMGRHAEALPIFEHALRMATEFGGDGGRVTQDTRRRMVSTYLALGRLDDAAESAAIALADARAQVGDDAVETGVALSLRARVLVAQQRLPDALRDADAAEAIFRARGDAARLLLEDLVTWRAGLPTPP